MGLTAIQIGQVVSAMKQAVSIYTDIGYCFERAMYVRNLLNMGEVMTFSASGIQLTSSKFSTQALMITPYIVIPYNASVYRDIVEWKYHSVFVLDNYVFTYEIPDWYCSLHSYKKAMLSINKVAVKAMNEKVVGYTSSCNF